jgi:hypothetical protein
MTTPTLSNITQWTPDHLTNLSDHYTTLAGERDSTMDAIVTRANNAEWSGEGKDGQSAALGRHQATASSEATIFRTTAGIASDAANDLSGQRQQLLDFTQTVQSAGFDVNDDFEAIDQDDPMGWREGIAQGLTADMQGQAQAFSAADQAAAASITGSRAGLGGTSMLDFKMGGGGGGDDPWNNPPMPPISGIGDPVDSAATTDLEQQAGNDVGWELPTSPGPPPKCGAAELARDTFDNVAAVATWTAVVATLPLDGWNPASISIYLGLFKLSELVGSTSNTELDCLQRGVTW